MKERADALGRGGRGYYNRPTVKGGVLTGAGTTSPQALRTIFVAYLGVSLQKLGHCLRIL